MKNLTFVSATIITPRGRKEFTDKADFIQAAKEKGFTPDENGFLNGKIAERQGEKLAVVDFR